MSTFRQAARAIVLALAMCGLGAEPAHADDSIFTPAERPVSGLFGAYQSFPGMPRVPSFNDLFQYCHSLWADSIHVGICTLTADSRTRQASFSNALQYNFDHDLRVTGKVQALDLVAEQGITLGGVTHTTWPSDAPDEIGWHMLSDWLTPKATVGVLLPGNVTISGTSYLGSAIGLSNQYITSWSDIATYVPQMWYVDSGNLIPTSAVDVALPANLRVATNLVVQGTATIGASNAANAAETVVLGGRNNTTEAGHSDGIYGAIIGGVGNVSGAYSGGIFAAQECRTSDNGAVVLGGWANNSHGAYAAIVGGNHNEVKFTSDFIGGGDFNVADGNSSATLGGRVNSVLASASVILGGGFSTVSAQDSGIMGGTRNVIDAGAAGRGASIILGGSNNRIDGGASTIISCNNSSVAISSDLSAIIASNGSTASGNQNVILGGSNISISGAYSKAIGLDGNGFAVSTDRTLAIMGGRVGIGTTSPGHALVVENDKDRFGYVDANGAWQQSSDLRLKRNITDLAQEDALSRVLALRPVRFDWREVPSIVAGEGANIGFIGQEVEEVLPELVSTDASTGLKGVSYAGFAPVLAGAIQALQRELESLKNDVRVCGNQAGTVTIAAGSTDSGVLFAEAYDTAPKVVVSLTASTIPVFARYAVGNKTVSGFRVFLDQPLPEDVSFDWMSQGQTRPVQEGRVM